jgi:Tfp pilus assembly protein PilF
MSSAADKTYRGQQLTVDKTLPLCASACARHRAHPAACVLERVQLVHYNYGREMLRAGQQRDARRALERALALAPARRRSQLMWAATFLGGGTLRRFYAVKDWLATGATSPAPRR